MGDVTKRPRLRVVSKAMQFSQPIADEICDRLTCGESLISICETHGFPNYYTVRTWLDKYPDFRLAYARAREAQAEHFVDEISLIADDGRNDYMEKVRRDGTKFVEADREHLERSKIRISTRQWIIERVLSAKYGVKPSVVVQNNQQNVVSVDPVEAAQIYQKTISGG